MTDVTAPLPLADQPPFAGNLRQIAEGEWTGWWKWNGTDPFEDATGPYYVRRDEQGIVCGFRPGPNNRNGHGMIHGGSLMTFADFSLFMIAGSGGTEMHGVTVTMNCEFVGPAQAGELLLARGDLVRGGRSVVFARGTITTESGVSVLAFSGTLKRFSERG
nr:PaaI family thioesterase [Novosphingobium sp. FKTRR1]